MIWSRRRRRWLDWDWIWSSTREGPPTAHMGAREPKRGLASEQKCSRPSNCVPAVAVCDLHTDSHRQKWKHRKCTLCPPLGTDTQPSGIITGTCMWGAAQLTRNNCVSYRFVFVFVYLFLYYICICVCACLPVCLLRVSWDYNVDLLNSPLNDIPLMLTFR